MRQLLGAQQVDVVRDEEGPGPCHCGPPAGDKGWGPEIGSPLGFLELGREESMWVVVGSMSCPPGGGSSQAITQERRFTPPGTKVWLEQGSHLPSHKARLTFSGSASYSPARMAGRVLLLSSRAASPYRYTARQGGGEQVVYQGLPLPTGGSAPFCPW